MTSAKRAAQLQAEFASIVTTREEMRPAVRAAEKRRRIASMLDELRTDLAHSPAKYPKKPAKSPRV